MALSLLQGRHDASQPLDTLYKNVQTFKEEFEKAFGTCECDLYVIYAVKEVEQILTCKE